MPTEELKKLLDRVHKNITQIEFGGKMVPCIIFPKSRYDEILDQVSGKPISISTNLNILDDRCGHVFVEIALEFSIGNIKEKILLYANDSLDFFESLALSSMLAISSPDNQNFSNILMVQLPRPEKAIHSLELIKKGIRFTGTN